MSAKTSTPRGWPDSLRYLRSLEFESRVPVEVRRLHSILAGSGSKRNSNSCGPSQIVRICVIDDPKHPACGQRGLFAARDLPAKSHVVDYLGIVRMDAHWDITTSDYVLGLSTGVSIDAAQAGNEARFVNDYRGIGVRPNVEFRERITQPTDITSGSRDASLSSSSSSISTQPAPYIMALFVKEKEIQRGEELLVSYGKGFWASR